MTNTVFSAINSINNKSDYSVGSEYSQFVTNKFYSLFRDTIFIANQANEFNGISDELHYGFLKSIVSKRKRFSKWPKADKDKINKVAAFFGINDKKAIEAIDILTDEQVKAIEEWHERVNDE